MTEPKRKAGGRPPFKLDDKDLRYIEQLSGLGLTIPKIAALVGCSESKFHELKNTNPAVSGALEKGRSLAEANVGKSLYEKALKGDTTAIIWWEKTRAGRSDRVDTSHDVNASGLASLVKALQESRDEHRRNGEDV